ncbi:MAG: hypothetical protein ACQGVK_24385 [Myxococcota bacterium]
MDHQAILDWLEAHPADVHGTPSEVVEQCEREVRRHAAEDAWRAATSYVEGRMHAWEKEWGFHASESSVAKETCAKLARELARHEPEVKAGDEAHLAGEALLAQLEPEARERVGAWVRDLAREVEHQIWREIVRFTKKEGRKLVRQGRVSSDHGWEAGENYQSKAAHVAQLLLEDYAREAHAD